MDRILGRSRSLPFLTMMAAASEPPLDTGSEEPHGPRTMSGKRPSTAALEREREYMGWLLTRPEPEGDVPQPDNSMAVFMAERRAEKERLRSQERAVARRHARFRQKYGRSPPLESEHVNPHTVWSSASGRMYVTSGAKLSRMLGGGLALRLQRASPLFSSDVRQKSAPGCASSRRSGAQLDRGQTTLGHLSLRGVVGRSIPVRSGNVGSL